MDAPPGRIPERGAEIEQQQQQPTVTEIIPDIFYTSICVASDATRDEILDAGVQAVVAYVKSDNPQSELDTIFTAFSTLYDPEARAAYDKYGQEMSTTVVEFSGTAPSHPDAANAMTSKPWIVVAVLLGSIVGSMTISLLNSQSALYVAGSAFIGYLHGNWITSNLPQVIHLKNVLAKIWSMAFGHHHSQQSLVAEEGESGESEPLLNGTNSTKTEQGRLIRNYGLKLLFDQLQQLPPFIIVTVVIFMMKIAIFTDGGFNTQHILALYNIGSGVFAVGCILRSIPRFVEIIRNKGMVRPHLLTLFKALRERTILEGEQLTGASEIRVKAAFEHAFLQCDSLLLDSAAKGALQPVVFAWYIWPFFYYAWQPSLMGWITWVFFTCRVIRILLAAAFVAIISKIIRLLL